MNQPSIKQSSFFQQDRPINRYIQKLADLQIDAFVCSIFSFIRLFDYLKYTLNHTIPYTTHSIQNHVTIQCTMRAVRTVYTILYYTSNAQLRHGTVLTRARRACRLRGSLSGYHKPPASHRSDLSPTRRLRHEPRVPPLSLALPTLLSMPYQQLLAGQRQTTNNKQASVFFPCFVSFCVCPGNDRLFVLFL